MKDRWKGWGVLVATALGVLQASGCTSGASPGGPTPTPSSRAAVAPPVVPRREPLPPPPAPVTPDLTLVSDPPSSANDVRSGTITFGPTGMPDGSYAPVASFFEELAIPSSCERRQAGLCSVEKCGAPASRQSGVVRRPSAGVLDLRVAGKLEHLEPTGEGGMQTYPQGSIADAPVGGELFEVEAHGDRKGIPAFTAKVHVPKGVRLLSPALGKSPKPFLIPQGKALAYAWSPASTGQLRVTITAMLPVGTTKVSCEFPASARAGVIPADIVAELQPGQVLLHTYDVVESQVVTAGKYAITVSAEAPRLAATRDESRFARIKAQ